MITISDTESNSSQDTIKPTQLNPWSQDTNPNINLKPILLLRNLEPADHIDIFNETVTTYNNGASLFEDSRVNASLKSSWSNAEELNKVLKDGIKYYHEIKNYNLNKYQKDELKILGQHFDLLNEKYIQLS
jgi:hypothetical protein